MALETFPPVARITPASAAAAIFSVTMRRLSRAATLPPLHSLGRRFEMTLPASNINEGNQNMVETIDRLKNFFPEQRAFVGPRSINALSTSR
jgi:hypothetical protein